jgi:hypothetical protein
MVAPSEMTLDLVQGPKYYPNRDFLPNDRLSSQLKAVPATVEKKMGKKLEALNVLAMPSEMMLDLVQGPE